MDIINKCQQTAAFTKLNFLQVQLNSLVTASNDKDERIKNIFLCVQGNGKNASLSAEKKPKWKPKFLFTSNNTERFDIIRFVRKFLQLYKLYLANENPSNHLNPLKRNLSDIISGIHFKYLKKLESKSNSIFALCNQSCIRNLENRMSKLENFDEQIKEIENQFQKKSFELQPLCAESKNENEEQTFLLTYTRDTLCNSPENNIPASPHETKEERKSIVKFETGEKLAYKPSERKNTGQHRDNLKSSLKSIPKVEHIEV